MKSIFEESEIVMIEIFEQTGSYQCADIAMHEFEKGANHVLEQIENMQTKTQELYDLIRQLKVK